jgi:hypothetical protein
MIYDMCHFMCGQNKEVKKIYIYTHTDIHSMKYKLDKMQDRQVAQLKGLYCTFERFTLGARIVHLV